MASFWYVGGCNGSIFRFEKHNRVSCSDLEILWKKYFPKQPLDTFDTTDYAQQETWTREFMIPKGLSRTPQWRKFKEGVMKL